MVQDNARARGERSCGACGLCCKLMGVSEIEKPAHSWCRHWSTGNGCAIYVDRPEACRIFDCWWRSDSHVPDVWYPAKARMVVTLDMGGKRLAVHADPARADAWKREPHHGLLREYASRMIPRGAQVVVYIGERCIAVLPDRDVDLGIQTGDYGLRYTPRQTPQGVRWDVDVVR